MKNDLTAVCSPKKPDFLKLVLQPMHVKTEIIMTSQNSMFWHNMYAVYGSCIFCSKTSCTTSLLSVWMIIVFFSNEKDGIPPNFLSLIDTCVEIPQYGVVRSLNVHVAASTFIWEYAKQHIIPR